MSTGTKYIFLTGGVVSSVGKGVTAAALGRLLKERGFKVSIQKLDPYINVDPGTMSPYQHGEVYVLDDGAETDLDLGHYERFIDISLSRVCNVTTGQVYSEVIGQGAARRFPGRDDPGHPAHHQRDQASHRPGPRDDRGRDGAGGSRRDGGRHRVAAVPGGLAPDAHRRRTREHAVHPRHLAAAHRRHRRAQDQADPALGARAALDRHLAGRDRRPLGLPGRTRTCARRSPCSATSRRGR